ncbi:unnamed protein product [Ixodes pacificus]
MDAGQGQGNRGLACRESRDRQRGCSPSHGSASQKKHRCTNCGFNSPCWPWSACGPLRCGAGENAGSHCQRHRGSSAAAVNTCQEARSKIWIPRKGGCCELLKGFVSATCARLHSGRRYHQASRQPLLSAFLSFSSFLSLVIKTQATQ